MIKHKKIYCTFFGYDYGDSISCEACLYNFNKNIEGVVREAVYIHHITPRGMGHSGKCDNINEIPNLMALCREHHIKTEGCKETNKKFRIIHLKNIIKKLEQ